MRRGDPGRLAAALERAQAAVVTGEVVVDHSRGEAQTEAELSWLRCGWSGVDPAIEAVLRGQLARPSST